MKRFLTIIFVFSTTAVYSQVRIDSYRAEIREELIKNHHPLNDWKMAKRALLQDIHLEKDVDGYFIEDVYCHKIIRKSVGPDLMPNGNMINIEHTWPQSKFPKKGSLTQKTDLHHLYPTDAKANSKRGNYPFSDFGGDRGYTVSGCNDSKMGYVLEAGLDGFEPPLSQKGNVARALFYFSVRYNIAIPDYEEIFLRQWNLLDPVDAKEMERNNRVEAIQGNRNSFIDNPELADLIDNF